VLHRLPGPLSGRRFQVQDRNIKSRTALVIALHEFRIMPKLLRLRLKQHLQLLSTMYGGEPGMNL
jgi:hypothetical protein